MDNQFSRQSFLGPESERVFSNCQVAIIGLGGGGSPVAQQLAHLGVGNFLVFDDDCVDDTNLNRLIGATPEDAANSSLKTLVATRLIKRINPKAEVVAIPKKWQERAALLRSSTVIFGCVDTFAARQEIETLARRYLIPYIDIGMDVHHLTPGYAVGGQVILSMPGELCMRCLGFLRDDLIAQEAMRYGAAGNRPQVVWPNGVLASLAVGIFVQLMTPWHGQHTRVAYLEYEGNSQTVSSSNRLGHLMETGARCPHFSNVEDVGDPFWEAEEIGDQDSNELDALLEKQPVNSEVE